MPSKESKPAPPKKAAAGKAAAGKGKPADKAAPPKKAVTKGASKGTSQAAKGKPSAAKGKVVKGKAPVEETQTGSHFKHLFQKRAKNHSIGNDILPRRDLTRYVKWPRYIRIARQKKILMNRLKVPPALNQFRTVLDKNANGSLYKLLMKYRPEERMAKRVRLTKIAKARAFGFGTVAATYKAPLSVVQGANQVVKAIEAKKAKLVLIAHDVDPVELVVTLPALCRKMDTPYAIVKSRSHLGHVVRRKWTSCIAVTDVRKEDRTELANLAVIARETFNDNLELRKQWGGGRLGQKSAAVIAKRQRLIAKELAARQKA